jgi:hypothetical protein
MKKKKYRDRKTLEYFLEEYPNFSYAFFKHWKWYMKENNKQNSEFFEKAK